MIKSRTLWYEWKFRDGHYDLMVWTQNGRSDLRHHKITPDMIKNYIEKGCEFILKVDFPVIINVDLARIKLSDDNVYPEIKIVQGQTESEYKDSL